MILALFNPDVIHREIDYASFCITTNIYPGRYFAGRGDPPQLTSGSKGGLVQMFVDFLEKRIVCFRNPICKSIPNQGFFALPQ